MIQFYAYVECITCATLYRFIKNCLRLSNIALQRNLILIFSSKILSLVIINFSRYSHQKS